MHLSLWELHVFSLSVFFMFCAFFYILLRELLKLETRIWNVQAPPSQAASSTSWDEPANREGRSVATTSTHTLGPQICVKIGFFRNGVSILQWQCTLLHSGFIKNIFWYPDVIVKANTLTPL